MERPPLSRSRDDRVLAGVCTGLAAHLGLPVGAVRIGIVLLGLLGGAGALFYVWLWVTVPLEGETDGIVPMRRALTRPAAGGSGSSGSDAGGVAASARAVSAAHGAGRPAAGETPAAVAGTPDPPTRRAADPRTGVGQGGAAPAGATGAPSQGAPAARRKARTRWPIAELLLGACLLFVGVALALTQFGVSINLELILPALAVLVGVGLTWWQITDRDRPDRNQLPRVLAALALVAVGVLMFFVTSQQPSVWTVIAASLAVLAGVALALAPWVLRINRELIAERAGRARESERAEIAAHLHDSVLQTLALIQQRSEPGSDVARIARGQERELREWLFRAADGAEAPRQEAIDTELRTHAAALEEEHSVRFEIVVVGGGAVVPEAIVAAAREAMLNAARHAGGEVTVYVECTPSRVSVDVTDRGAGLDLEALPDGRMGVRESILGRMTRAGGTARIVAGPGGTGTSVRLSLARADDAQPDPQPDVQHPANPRSETTA